MSNWGFGFGHEYDVHTSWIRYGGDFFHHVLPPVLISVWVSPVAVTELCTGARSRFGSQRPPYHTSVTQLYFTNAIPTPVSEANTHFAAAQRSLWQISCFSDPWPLLSARVWNIYSVAPNSSAFHHPRVGLPSLLPDTEPALHLCASSIALAHAHLTMNTLQPIVT